MHKVEENPKMRWELPSWHLLSVCLLIKDGLQENGESERSAGLLVQALRELSLPLETLKRVEAMIMDLVSKEVQDFMQGIQNGPVYISLFCNRNSESCVAQPEGQAIGGWGYYVIERSRHFSGQAWPECRRVVEIYLYKEGE